MRGSARVRPRPRDHRATSTSWRSRAAARSCSGGARSLLRASRVDQFVHRDGAAVAEPRRDQSMDAKLGHETDALAFLADAGRGAVPLRLLPDAAAARVPVRRQAALGTSAAAGRRARAAGAGSGSRRSRRRRWRRSSRHGRRAAAPAGAGCSACSAPTGRCRFTSPSTRASGCATPAIRRSAASSTSSTIGSSRCSTGPGRRRSRTSTAIGRQTIASPCTSARSSASRRRRCAIATRCRTWRSCFTSAR